MAAEFAPCWKWTSLAMKKPEFQFHISETDNFVSYDFDRRSVRKSMRRAAKVVRDRSRRLVNVTGKRNNYPSRRTGALANSIRSRLSRSGFLARIAPEKTSRMKAFYPAYLHYGVKNNPLRGAERAKARRRGTLSGTWRIKPRNNYMVDALRSSTRTVKEILIKGFKEALWKGK